MTYRVLADSEQAAFNNLNDVEEDILKEIEKISINSNFHVNHRWLSIAKTHIEQGFMAARRAIARPDEK